MGEHAKEKGTRKVGGAGKKKRKRKEVSSRFIFVFAVSQFSGPDYFGAWNRLARMLSLTISFALNPEEFHVVVVEGKELEVVSSTKLLTRNQSLFCKKDALQIRVFLA